MYAKVLSASLNGITGEETWAEVDTELGLQNISIVGLANQATKEAKQRVQAAIVNCGFDFPIRKITINLTPANKQKEGSHYDLAIALGVLISTNQLPEKDCFTGETAFLGELTLDGTVNQVDGVLPMVIGLQKSGVKKVFIPSDNLSEAALVKDMLLYPVKSLKEVTDHVIGEKIIDAVLAEGYVDGLRDDEIPDFAEIKGQEMVKRAAQVAVSGMHGLLMIGPPGVGKSMVGKRIPGIMPALSYEEELDVTEIYSVAGLLGPNRPMITQRPFRAPHHSMSATALIGGGAKPKPGEISLAHSGVLFLDELPEFSSHTLDMLRQPLEDGFVSITRVNGKCVFPSNFMLVAAMNPCRCGYYGDPIKPCSCTPSDRKRYISKISGPLLDRIDIHVAMERVAYDDLSSLDVKSISTEELKSGVIRAFRMQQERYKNLNINYNSELSPAHIKRFCTLDKESSKLMQDAFNHWNLSARAYHRILKVARSIADLSESESIKTEHVLEALNYRMPEKFFN